MNWLGNYPEDFSTVAIYFTTHDVNGAPVAPLSGFESADVKIYKNGSNAEKTSTNGLTMTSPFDSLTGLHCLLIDTSNDTGDAGFWVAGSVYTVILNPDTETVAGQTVLKVLGTFGITLGAINLDKTTKAIARGTVTSGGSTTSVPTSALSIAGAAASGVVADQFKGRSVLFDGDTTTAGLRGTMASINASSASNTPTLTVSTLPATPASGDAFSVI